MIKQVCILFSIAVVVPVVYSCCVPAQWQGLEGVAIGTDKDGKPGSIEVTICWYWKCFDNLKLQSNLY